MKRRTLWIVLLAGVVSIGLGVTAISYGAPRAWFAPVATETASPDLDAQAEPVQFLAQAPPAQRPDLRRRLNLTDEQARRVEAIMTTFRSRTERLRIDLARARLDAREALLEATPDRARLEAIARRTGDLQGQLTRARFDMLVELKAVLTPEQWSRLRFGEGLRRGPRGRMR